jgi:hypothetical protein
MSASWEIAYWPHPSFHAFLSHCQEDRNRLVLPVYNLLKRERVLPWLDIHDYPVGKDPFEALRANLLYCRHVIYFVTPKYLKQGRGWCATERALAELIQRHFVCSATSLWDYELPLLFLDRRDETLTRSVWQQIASRGLLCPHPKTSVKACREWAVAQIKRLIQQQYAENMRISERINLDPRLQTHLNGCPGLKERLLSQSPDNIV